MWRLRKYVSSWIYKYSNTYITICNSETLHQSWSIKMYWIPLSKLKQHTQYSILAFELNHKVTIE